MKHILSYGGGLNSTALLVYLVKNNDKYPLDMVIFADTGNEFQHTYDTVQIYKEYCRIRGIPFEIVKSKHGEIYDYYYNKKITPNRIKRDCTSKFKVSPIRKYIRTKYPEEKKFVFYIGIDFGEYHRVRESDVKYIENNYPLVDMEIDRKGCIDILNEEDLPIPEKSGCYFCPFTKKQNWLNMIDENAELYEKAIILEENSIKFPKSVSLLSSKPLREIRDNYKRSMDTKLDEYTPSCDVQGSCFL